VSRERPLGLHPIQKLPFCLEFKEAEGTRHAFERKLLEHLPAK